MKEDRYKIYSYTRKDGVKEIVALSTYAGKKVKGKAVCDPTDEYNENVGKELAKLRCAVKVDAKRVRRAIEERNELLRIQANIEKLIQKNKKYLVDSLKREEEDNARLNDLLDELI